MSNAHETGVCEIKSWFITGATGFIGKEIIRRILQETDDKLFLLIRSRRGRSAETRLNELLSEIGQLQAGNRVVVCDGDASEPDFGLSPRIRADIVTNCSHILHLAAVTRFDASLQRLRSINVVGTRSMLTLVEEAFATGRLRKAGHVSTAYVVGSMRGTVAADDLQAEGPFRNNYERSKLEAELLVRAASRHLPISIFRPSIVVGDSRTGAFSGFSVIYPFIYAYLKGLNVTFGRDDTVLDIVPVDYVVSAILRLMSDPAATRPAYILAGGDRTAVTQRSLRRTVVSMFDGERRIWCLSPRLFGLVMWLWQRKGISPRMQHLVRGLRPYLPYLKGNPRFDVSMTEEALAGTGIEVPPFDTYADRLAQYCLAQGWGEGSPVLSNRGVAAG